MTSCTRCGHDVGQGRFCAQCGHQVATAHAEAAPTPDGEAAGAAHEPADDWRTGTAERPRVPAAPVTPRHPDRTDPVEPTRPADDAEDAPRPAETETSPWGTTAPGTVRPPRWPLYADEVTGPPRPRPEPDAEPDTVLPALLAGAAVAPGPGGPGGPGGRGDSTAAGARGRRVLPWVVGAAVVVLLAGLGAFLLLGGLGAGQDPSETAVDADASGADAEADPTGVPAEQETTRPPSPSPSPSPTRRPAKPVDVTDAASVRAPRTAPPGVDVEGDPVRYDATNMLDGDPTTAWRTAGDGSGLEITLDLDQRTDVTRVGLINGYAKSEPGYDGYTANRRVTEAGWTFDDGTTVTQSLGDSRSLQVVDVPDVGTRTVTLTLRSVSAPGRTDGRNYTAISELAVVGTPPRR